jgi:hypothetical protein
MRFSIHYIKYNEMGLIMCCTKLHPKLFRHTSSNKCNKTEEVDENALNATGTMIRHELAANPFHQGL